MYKLILKNKDKSDWKEKIQCIENSTSITNNVWGIRNIYDLDKSYFLEYFEKYLCDYEEFYDKMYEDSRIIYLRDCIRWIYEKNLNKIRLMKLPPINELSDKSWFDIDNYINGYNSSAFTEVTREEIAIVQGYNDEILRKKIANILKNIDMHIINRECTKAHGGYEIADMELPIRKGLNTYYICIPVKSGVEIATKVKENIAYQVMRPFTYFGNKAIVIFISAKDATEPFYNYVKRAQANLNFDIYTIAGTELAKLLKYNNQID